MATLTQERTKGYYHCLECGAIFEADLKDPSDQRCSICGHPPTGGILTGNEEETFAPSSEVNEIKPSELSPRPSVKHHGINHDTQDIYEATMATMAAQKESRSGRVTRVKRREKKGVRRWVFLVGWLVLMLGVIALFEMFGPDEESDSVSQNGDSALDQREAAAEEQKNRRMINEAIPACEKSMTEFLFATSAAAKAQYVYQGVKLSGVMNRYYRDELSFSASDSRVKITRAELLEGFNRTALGALCMNSQGEKWEAIFLFDEDEWKIDWAALVRYDDRSWSLFPAGKEGAEGEFRLYMRVRDMNEDFEQEDMSLVFYKPTMFFKDEYRGVASDPVTVPIDSELGRRISALLDQEDAVEKVIRKDVHGLSVGLIDPSRYHRVRVKMRIHKEGRNDKNSRVELLEILANHWYGFEAKAVESEANTETSE
jgi:hypothetical protein